MTKPEKEEAATLLDDIGFQCTMTVEESNCTTKDIKATLKRIAPWLERLNELTKP